MHGAILLLLLIFGTTAIVSSTFPVASGALQPAAQASPENTYHLSFNSSLAWSELETIMTFNPRYPGTIGDIETGDFIARILQKNNATVVNQTFLVEGIRCKNIIGEWSPQNSTPKNVVIFASHYDSRARATFDPNPANRDLPIPAANDGGSSTVVLLALAPIIARIYAYAAPNVTAATWLVFFDAEDQGTDNGPGMPGFDWCEGSSRLAADLSDYLPSGQSVSAFVLLDMIGAPGMRVNSEQNSDQTLLTAYRNMGKCLGYGQYFPDDAPIDSIEDDHLPFIEDHPGFPAIDVIDITYLQMHTISDDLAHVSPVPINAIGRVSEGFLVWHITNITNLAVVDGNMGHTWTASCKPPIILGTGTVVLIVVIVGVIALAISVWAWMYKRRRVVKRASGTTRP
jgi:hypothetical protein